MKRKLATKSMTIAAILLALVFGISVGQAYASTGCFTDTNGHWAETFICWMKDNGITSGTGGGAYSPNNNVTRAEMAVFMQKLDDLAIAQANAADATNLTEAKNYTDGSLTEAKNYTDSSLTEAKNYTDNSLTEAKNYTDSSLSSGNILISAGFGNWHPFNSTDPLSYTYFSSQTQVTRSSIGSSFLSINPDIPTVLYGKSLKFMGVEFCFDTFASTSLNYVEINTYSHTTGSLGRNLRFSDPTTRTGNECRLYTLSSPIVLTADAGVNLFIQVNWTAAASQFAIGRTTFIFEPTTTIAAPPAVPQILQDSEEAPISPEFDTSAP
ncbi:MAG: S-layer homology domain-containing protein [Anaerolineales bacterium]|nr:S-layer homology domain-containing protein [Anaerolineales bacterium]